MMAVAATASNQGTAITGSVPPRHREIAHATGSVPCQHREIAHTAIAMVERGGDGAPPMPKRRRETAARRGREERGHWHGGGEGRGGKGRGQWDGSMGALRAKGEVQGWISTAECGGKEWF